MENTHIIKNLIDDFKKTKRNNFLDFLCIDKKLVFFGAGNWAKNLMNLYNILSWFTHLTPEYFVDNDAGRAGQIFCGYPIVSFTELLTEKDDVKIMITSTAEYYVILKQLKDYDFKHILEYDCDPTGIIPNSMMPVASAICRYKELHDSCFSYRDELAEVYDLFEDGLSKKTLEALISYRLDYDLLHLRLVSRAIHSYFDEGFLNFTDNEVLLDLGAHTGDSIFDFHIHTEGRYRMIYSFEPDASLYEQLIENIEKMPDPKRIKLFNVAVCNSNGASTFDARQSTGGATLTTDGDIEVNTVRLDDFSLSDLGDAEVTFIKMDIEGAEVEALKGACKLIQRRRPKLAVSVYHKSDDLWRIPLLIKEINPEYKLYLRHQYACSSVESVLYAI